MLKRSIYLQERILLTRILIRTVCLKQIGKKVGDLFDLLERTPMKVLLQNIQIVVNFMAIRPMNLR